MLFVSLKIAGFCGMLSTILFIQQGENPCRAVGGFGAVRGTFDSMVDYSAAVGGRD
jgi:hypothetical protein